jgi:pimeloyl-ACP methyl ester carboxylesterase
MAGHGPEAMRLGITHRDCVGSIVNYVDEQALNDVVLVGHSFGGTVVQGVVQQVANRITRMVFLDALLLTDGQCVFDTLPTDMVGAFNTLAAASSENTMLIPWEIWRDSFMQDASESEARSVWERLSPEPNQVNIDKLDLRVFYSLPIPRSFIWCRQDKALPPGSFHPTMSSRLGKFDLIEMDGGHEVMFTRPAELADKIIEASAV